MEKDPTYEKFLAALKDIAKKNWYRRYSVLAEEAGMSQGYLSDIIKGKKRASFKIQTALIKAATDCSYEEFLELGRQIIEKEKPVKKSPTKTIAHKTSPELNLIQNSSHDEIIEQFEDKEWARVLNAKLVEIEKIGGPDFKKKIDTYIDDMLALVRVKQSRKDGKKRNVS